MPHKYNADRWHRNPKPCYYTGGMNMGKEHLDGGEGFDFWRDTQVRIVGQGAAVLQTVFMVDSYRRQR